MKKGCKHSDETRAKISETLRNKPPISEETRAKMSKASKNRSPETRAKIGAASKGRKHSPEAIEKSTVGRRGVKRPPEVCAKISESLKGKKHSEESRAKMSEASKGRKHSDKTRAKISKAKKGENNPSWKGGISTFPYCERWTPDLRERVRNFYGRVCVECSKTEIENGKKLSVHHVNFDKESCCNDVKPLFVCLCSSCHSKTNHNREYWKERYTNLINEKYNGQCYLPKSTTTPEAICSEN